MADEKKKIEYYGEPTTIAKLLSIIDGVHGYSKGLQDRPYDIDMVLLMIGLSIRKTIIQKRRNSKSIRLILRSPTRPLLPSRT